MRQLGAWLEVNGEAIYQTQPWQYQNDTSYGDVWYTRKAGAVFAILLKYPSTGRVTLTSPRGTTATDLSLLGYDGKVVWTILPTEGKYNTKMKT